MPLPWALMVAHRKQPVQDAALALLIDSVKKNTPPELYEAGEIVIDDRPDICPYRKWNEMCAKTKTAINVVFANNDMVMLPGWHCMVTATKPRMVVTGYLIEPGIVAVNPLNVQRDFGGNPADYRADEAIKFAATVSAHTQPEIAKNSGWYMPCAFDREWFLSVGGYDIGAGQFPNPLDRLFWDKAARIGVDFVRVNSWAYHFQRLSQRPEGQAKNN